MATDVCDTLPTPQNTAEALEGVVVEAGELTPSFPGTAALPEENVTTVAGTWVRSGKFSEAVGGTPPQLMNGTAARGRLTTRRQGRGALLHPCRMILCRVWRRSRTKDYRRQPSAAPRPRLRSTRRRRREQRQLWVILWSQLAIHVAVLASTAFLLAVPKRASNTTSGTHPLAGS